MNPPIIITRKDVKTDVNGARSMDFPVLASPRKGRKRVTPHPHASPFHPTLNLLKNHQQVRGCQS